MKLKKNIFSQLWDLFLGLPISLSKKIIIMIAFLEFGAIITTGTFILLYAYFIFEDNTNKRAAEVAKSLEKFTIETLVQNDFSRLQKISEELVIDKSIRYIIIQDRFGQAVVHSNYHYVGLKFNDKNSTRAFYATKDFYQNYYSVSGTLYVREYVLPLETPFGRLGLIRVGMNYDLLVWDPLKNTIIIIFLATIIFVIMGIFIAIPATKMLLIPVKAVYEATHKVAEGDLTFRVQVLSKDEIGEMAQAFNQMIENQKKLVGIIREIAEKILVLSNDLASSSEEVSVAALQTSKTVNEVANDAVKGSEYTVQVNISLDSFINLLNDSKMQADKSYQLAQKTFNLSSSGKDKMNLMSEVSQRIFEGAQITLNSINELYDLSKKIENIASTINGLAGQITLLSLNASIEAARAGEFGKGFAVVADEISKLAEQSSKQAKEVNQIVNMIIKYTKQNVEIMKKQFELVNEGQKTTQEVRSSLEKIIESAKNISEETKIIKEIADREVNESSEVVNRINELNRLMQKTASSTIEVNNTTKETTSAMEELAIQSQKLSELVIELKRLISQFKT